MRDICSASVNSSDEEYGSNEPKLLGTSRMVLFNYSTKELTAKIVYYGPGLCGKTTNLQYIHSNLPGNVKGKMLSLATKTDRTLFFDFLPIDLGEIRGMKTRVQLYTVPGQVFYNETRKLVLKGADGIIFVADSQEQMLSANVESFKNLEENLKGHGLSLAEMPHAIQFNKRDLPKLASIEQLNSTVNKYNAPFYETVATTGIGVQDTLKAITKLVLLHLTKKYDPRGETASKAAAPAAPRAAAPAIAPIVPIAPSPSETQAIPLASTPQPAAQPPIEIPQPAPAPAPQAIEIPQAAPQIAASIEPTDNTDQHFDDSEIEDLVGEVGEAGEFGQVEEITDIPAARNPFAVDTSSLAIETPTTDSAAAVAPEPQQAQQPEVNGPPSIDVDFGAEIEAPTTKHEIEIDDDATSESSEGEVTLTEVAADDVLFNDPELNVARIEPGTEREIIVPVELGSGGEMRRFKLSIRLRVDDVPSDS
jgi:signal recognition particle receptor subunit beta